MSEQKFFKCAKCGNFVGLINNAGVPMTCCGEPMEEMVPNTVEASTEKHIPEVTISGNTVLVKVGAVAHPMTNDHHIEFIYLQTQNGGQRKGLKIDGQPEAAFQVVADAPLAVFAYCNLHGIWKVDLGSKANH